MELKAVDGGGRADGRLVRFAGGKGTPVYKHDGGRLGIIEWFALDPLSGRIVLVTISRRRFALFARKQATLPWSALSLDEATGRLMVRAKRPADESRGAGFTPVSRRDPARAE